MSTRAVGHNTFLLLLCGVAAIVSLVLHDPFALRSGSYSSAPKLLEFESSRVRRVKINRGGEAAFALERRSDGWQLSLQQAVAKADPAKVEAALLALEGMRRHQLAGEYPAFERALSGKDSLRIELELDAGKRVSTELGKASEDGTHARAATEAEVFFVRGDQREPWLSAERFVERRLHPQRNSITALRVSGPYAYALAPARDGDPSRYSVELYGQTRAADSDRVRLLFEELEKLEGESCSNAAETTAELQPYGTLVLRTNLQHLPENRIEVVRNGSNLCARSSYNPRFQGIPEHRLKLVFRDASYFVSHARM